MGHEIDFLPAAIEIIERPVSPAARWVAGSISAFTFLALVWASVGKVDLIATARGRILPVGNSKVIQPFERGVVKAIRVSDGDHVEVGQVLVELDSVAALADRDRFALDWVNTQLEIARLGGLRRYIANQSLELVNPPVDAMPLEIEAARASMKAEVDEHRAKVTSFERQIAAKNASAAEASEQLERVRTILPVATEAEALRKQLKDDGNGSVWSWLQAKEHLIEQQHSLPALEKHRAQAIEEAAALSRQIEQTRAEFEHSVLNRLAEAERKAGEYAKERDKADEFLSLLTLRAPIGGTIQQLAIHTVGGVISPAENVMVIVPDEAKLVVEAHVENKDIGFVHPGQEAEIKVEAFNYSRYGLIQGRVLDLSRDAVESDSRTLSGPERGKKSPSGGAIGDEDQVNGARYVVHVALDRASIMTEDGAVPLGAGMSVTAEIKTGRRTVISYLLSPIIRYHHESMTER